MCAAYGELIYFINTTNNIYTSTMHEHNE